MRTRSFHGEAATDVSASPEECFALLAAVDRYPDWCPDAIRDVQILDQDADGQPSRVRMTIHVSWASIEREFQLLFMVAIDPPRSVTLTRFTDHPTNQQFTATWRVHTTSDTRISLQLDAALRVPPYIPAGGIADEIAEAFVAAASRVLARVRQ